METTHITLPQSSLPPRMENALKQELRLNFGRLRA